MSSSSPGLRLGRVVGVPVYLQPSWFLFAAFVLVSTGPALSERYGTGLAYATGASFAVLLLASVLLHEIGHAVVARAFGLPVRSITVTFLAGLTEITEPPQTPGREYAVAVVGPMVSLLLSGVGVACAGLFPSGSLPQLLFLVVATSNGIVAAFNLLPGLPLDGGRVLRAGVWQLTGDPDRSTVVAAWAGRVVALVIVPVTLLVVLPLLGLGEPTIGSAVFTALIAAFVFAGATASLQRTRVLSRLPAATVEALARPALVVTADTPLGEAVRRAQEAGVRGLVVADSAGRLEAVVNEASLVAVPETRRPWVSIATVSRRLEPGMVLDPSLGGEELLTALRTTPASEYVVEGPAEGQVRVLSVEDVLQQASAAGRRG